MRILYPHIFRLNPTLRAAAPIAANFPNFLIFSAFFLIFSSISALVPVINSFHFSVTAWSFCSPFSLISARYHFCSACVSVVISFLSVIFRRRSDFTSSIGGSFSFVIREFHSSLVNSMTHFLSHSCNASLIVASNSANLSLFWLCFRSSVRSFSISLNCITDVFDFSSVIGGIIEFFTLSENHSCFLIAKI